MWNCRMKIVEAAAAADNNYDDDSEDKYSNLFFLILGFITKLIHIIFRIKFIIILK